MPDSTGPQPNAMGDTDYSEFFASLNRFFATPAPAPRRVFHGRGRHFPGLEHLVADWYPPVLLVTFYREPERTAALLAAIRAADISGQVGSVILQRRQRQGAGSEVLWGDPVESCVVVENGLRFEVRPGLNRNAGLFLDMGPLREWLRSHSQERNVLNLFAYTCSLSVAALAGGASHVTSVDMNKPSIQWGLRNHLLNDQDLSRVTPLAHNLFTSWGRIQQLGRYDLVIVDPPTRQRGSFEVEKNYPAVIRRLPKLVNAGADLIVTINSPFLGADYLIDQFSKQAPGLQFVGQLPIAPEFEDRYPERGLNICHFRSG
ncbi:MAG: class I SAM-dependent methyltransferase [Gammaproteobacteria bacterium]